MEYGNNEKINFPSLIWKTVDERIRENIKIYSKFLAQGKEFWYDPLQDKLYSDHNMTMTTQHLGMTFLKNILPTHQYEKAESIIKNQNRSKISRVRSIAKLMKGYTVAEVDEAGERAASQVEIVGYMKKRLKSMKPTRLTIFSDTPKEVVEIHVMKKLNPIYNFSGEVLPIKIHAPHLENENGLLTGNISSLPDEIYRSNLRHIEQMHYLKSQIELIE